MSNKNNGKSVRSVKRAIDILYMLLETEKGYGIKELSIKTKLPPATVHRLVNTLTLKNTVEFDKETEKYKVTFKTLTLFSSLLGKTNIIAMAKPILKKLTQEISISATLACFDYKKENIFIIAEEKPDKIMTTNNLVGKILPAYCTALGKIFLAEEYASNTIIIKNLNLKKITHKTVTLKNKFIKELIQIKKQGYATEIEEFEKHTTGLAVPIYNGENKPVAALGVWSCINNNILNNSIIKKLKQVSQELSIQLYNQTS